MNSRADAESSVMSGKSKKKKKRNKDKENEDKGDEERPVHELSYEQQDEEKMKLLLAMDADGLRHQLSREDDLATIRYHYKRSQLMVNVRYAEDLVKSIVVMLAAAIEATNNKAVPYAREGRSAAGSAADTADAVGHVPAHGRESVGRGGVAPLRHGELLHGDGMLPPVLAPHGVARRDAAACGASSLRIEPSDLDFGEVMLPERRGGAGRAADVAAAPVRTFVVSNGGSGDAHFVVMLRKGTPGGGDELSQRRESAERAASQPRPPPPSQAALGFFPNAAVVPAGGSVTVEVLNL